MLKKYFPISYKADSVGGLIVSVLIYLVIGAIAGAVLWLAGAITGWIPLVGALVGWVLRIIGSVVEIYNLIGIVVALLVFLKVVK